MKRKHAFTLVELLVVIGIIGLLLSILLPALSRARDQANATLCQSNMHQFYNLFMLYVDDYRGYVLPAVNQHGPPPGGSGNGPEYDFYSYTLLGHELNRSGISDNFNLGVSTAQAEANVSLADNFVIQHVFHCPSANHDRDPNVIDPTTSNPAGSYDYWGDYIYNIYMGQTKVNSTTHVQYVVWPIPQISKVPNNVILLTESLKPNFTSNGNSAGSGWGNNALNTLGYKDYFTSWGDLIYAQGASNAQLVDKIGTPHAGGKKCFFLSADGHVSYMDPFQDVGGVVSGVTVKPATSAQMASLNLPEPRVYYYQPPVVGRTQGITFANWLIGPGPNSYGETSSIAGGGSGATVVPTVWDKSQPGLP